eukprot:1605901-Rhodomonas_salina.1
MGLTLQSFIFLTTALDFVVGIFRNDRTLEKTVHVIRRLSKLTRGDRIYHSQGITDALSFVKRALQSKVSRSIQVAFIVDNHYSLDRSTRLSDHLSNQVRYSSLECPPDCKG